MAPFIARTEKVSGPVKSFFQHFRTMLATRKAANGSAVSATDWDALLGEALQQQAPSSDDDAARLTAMAQIMRSPDFRTKISTADWLLLEDNYRGAIALYDRIAIDHPEELAFCQRCVGTAHYYLGNYETAIDFYRKAQANGENADIIAADISEANDAIAMRDQQRREAA